MKTKHYCWTCKTELENADGFCPVCKKNCATIDRYFPDDPKNKVFAVDTYITVCKCYKVEAASAEDAESKIEDEIGRLARHCTDAEWIRRLASEGFSDAEELELRVSGEADENGEIEYY